MLIGVTGCKSLFHRNWTHNSRRRRSAAAFLKESGSAALYVTLSNALAVAGPRLILWLD